MSDSSEPPRRWDADYHAHVMVAEALYRPGEVFERGRSRGTPGGGSEATETWRPGERDDMIVNRRDEAGVPKKRVP